jgi:hypothetical protein
MARANSYHNPRWPRTLHFRGCQNAGLRWRTGLGGPRGQNPASHLGSERVWPGFPLVQTPLAHYPLSSSEKQIRLKTPDQPAFSPRGEICFKATDWTLRESLVHYYDGQTWRRWDRARVGYQQPGHLGQPFFAKDGRLAINITGSRLAVTCIFNGTAAGARGFRISCWTSCCRTWMD